MKTYYVEVEGVVNRTLRIEAKNRAEASDAARQEFASMVGANKSETFTLGMVEDKT